MKPRNPETRGAIYRLTRNSGPAELARAALGAAYLAGLQAGICPEPQEFQTSWALEHRVTPSMPDDQRAQKYARWTRAITATMSV